MQQLVQWGFLKEKKILVSAQEDAKPSDRSMSAHFIKMTVNGRFSLKKIMRVFKNVKSTQVSIYKTKNSKGV